MSTLIDQCVAGQQLDGRADLVGGLGVLEIQLDGSGDGVHVGMLTLLQTDAEREMHDVDDFELHLHHVRILLLPPLPAVVLKHLRGLYPDGPVPLLTGTAPARVHLAVHSILQLQHGDDLLFHEHSRRLMTVFYPTSGWPPAM